MKYFDADIQTFPTSPWFIKFKYATSVYINKNVSAIPK